MMVQEKLSVKIARLEKELEALHRGVSADLRPAEEPEEDESSLGERSSGVDKSSYTSSVQAVLRARTVSATSAETAISSSTAASDSTRSAKIDAADAGDTTRSLELRLAALATQDSEVGSPDSAATAGGVSPAEPVTPPSPPPSAATGVSEEGAAPAPLEVPKQRGDASSAASVEPVRRRATNPFRVISVGGSSTVRRSQSGADGQTARPPSTGDKAAPMSADEQSMLKLQRKHDYLIMKCVKLSKEIKYLTNLKKNGSLSVEDTRKMNDALEKLQEYLDRKSKEKYEIGVLLSRRIRKHINNGSNGQFWLSGK
ncbi:AaceriAFR027Cp [[Ashbya] aceris (nom. inval.)]|nr:AaceriAFR027Cp [[Ashbya] aceris (nom. inval.)]